MTARYPRCTCVDPFSSVGCRRCCSYGSPEQQRAQAERLAAPVPSPAAQAQGETPIERARKQREELIFVNAYPDEDYPLRILRAHLEGNTGSYITDNFAGLPPTSPLIVAMNEASAERAKILRAAIDRLSVPPATPQAQGETVWRSEPPTLDEIEDCPFWWWSGDGDKPIAVEVWPEEVGGRGYVPFTDLGLGLQEVVADDGWRWAPCVPPATPDATREPIDMHAGSEGATCPECGSLRMFDDYDPDHLRMPAAAKRWRCLGCGATSATVRVSR